MLCVMVEVQSASGVERWSIAVGAYWTSDVVDDKGAGTAPDFGPIPGSYWSLIGHLSEFGVRDCVLGNRVSY